MIKNARNISAARIDVAVFNEYKQKKLLKCQSHPSKDLLIWNYAETVQLHGPWDAVTTKARGLVTNSNGDITAHSFLKFHNIEQNMHTPTAEYIVYEKMDGSLGILFWHDGEWIICSRGSFTSDQAQMARQILESSAKGYCLDALDKTIAYSFEIIYPENRIVVDYGTRVDLVFLAAFAKDGTEVDCDAMMQDAGFTVVTKYHSVGDAYTALKTKSLPNMEGYVVRFTNGDRVKIKFAEYLQLHKIVTNINALTVWEMFTTGKPVNEQLELVPDEFQRWVHDKYAHFEKQYLEMYEDATSVFTSIRQSAQTRSEFAKAVKLTHVTPKLLFALYDNRPIKEMICDMIRPVNGVFNTPFIGCSKQGNAYTHLTKQQTVLILVGPSASGKSTWAHTFLQENPTYVRVNRDCLRQLLFGYSHGNMHEYYNNGRYHEREKMITAAEMMLIKGFLQKGKHVIIDNTNLKRKYIDAYCKECKHMQLPNTVLTITFKVFDVTSIDECTARDKLRPVDDQVGAAKIKEQHMSLARLQEEFAFQDIVYDAKHVLQQRHAITDQPKGYIFDIDGTLADNTHRSPYDWSRVKEDVPIVSVVETLQAHARLGYKVAICSGRDECCIEATKEWLQMHNIPYDELHMRPRGNTRPDSEVKEVMWRDILTRMNVVAMYDDRNSVVQHARRCGFQVFQVNEGNF